MLEVLFCSQVDNYFASLSFESLGVITKEDLMKKKTKKLDLKKIEVKSFITEKDAGKLLAGVGGLSDDLGCSIIDDCG